jgi:hypothetical protein
MQRPDVPSYSRITSFDEAQGVPKRLHLLPPRVEIRGSLSFFGALHRLAPAPMRGSDTPGHRANIVVCRPPAPRVSSKRLKRSIDCLPGTTALEIVAGIALSSRNSPPQAGKRVLAQDVRMPGPKPRQRLDHDIGVAKFGQRAMDRTKPFGAPAASPSAILADEPQDGADFLHALSRLMDLLFASRSATANLIARLLEFLPHEAPKPVRY